MKASHRKSNQKAKHVNRSSVHCKQFPFLRNKKDAQVTNRAKLTHDY